MKQTANSPFLPTDYSLFDPVDKTVVWLTNSHKEDAPSSNSTVAIMASEREFSSVYGPLKQAGFRRVSRISKQGTDAVILEANDHQMIRIVSSGLEREDIGIENVHILKPIDIISSADDEYCIKVFPKVHTLAEILSDDGIAEHYVRREANEGNNQFKKRLKDWTEELTGRLVADMWCDDGEFFFDPKLSNIAIVKDKSGHNVPVVLDRGSMVKCDDITDEHVLAFLAAYYDNDFSKIKNHTSIEQDHLNAFFLAYYHGDSSKLENYVAGKDISQEYVDGFAKDLANNTRQHIDTLLKQQHASPLLYEEAQKAHLKLLGLTEGKISGVVSSKELTHKVGGGYKEYKGAGSGVCGFSGPVWRTPVWKSMLEEGLYLEERERIVRVAAQLYKPCADEDLPPAIKKRNKQYQGDSTSQPETANVITQKQISDSGQSSNSRGFCEEISRARSNYMKALQSKG